MCAGPQAGDRARCAACAHGNARSGPGPGRWLSARPEWPDSPFRKRSAPGSLAAPQISSCCPVSPISAFIGCMPASVRWRRRRCATSSSTPGGWWFRNESRRPTLPPSRAESTALVRCSRQCRQSNLVHDHPPRGRTRSPSSRADAGLAAPSMRVAMWKYPRMAVESPHRRPGPRHGGWGVTARTRRPSLSKARRAVGRSVLACVWEADRALRAHERDNLGGIQSRLH